MLKIISGFSSHIGGHSKYHQKIVTGFVIIDGKTLSDM